MTWPRMKVADLCQLVRGSSPRPQGDPRYFGGPVPRLMIEDLTRDGKYVTPKVDSLTVEGASRSRPMQQGELVMTVSGRTGVPAILAIDACIHDGFVGFRELSPMVNTEYLFYYFSLLTEQTNSKSVGAIFKNLTTDQIKNLEVPLPPLEVQQRIADTLDTADALRRKERELLGKYDELAQSIFCDMFDGKHEAETADKCLTLVGGAAFQSTDFVKQGLPVIRIGTINKGYFDKQQLVFLPIEHRKAYHRYVVQSGDLLMTLTGTVGKDDYGNVFVLDDSFPSYFLNQRVTKLEFDRSVFTTEYLQHYFKQKTVKDKLTGISRGVRQANISNKDIYALKIPVPSLREQQQFSKSLQLIRASSATVIQSRSETLFMGLLSKYFA